MTGFTAIANASCYRSRFELLSELPSNRKDESPLQLTPTPQAFRGNSLCATGGEREWGGFTLVVNRRSSVEGAFASMAQQRAHALWSGGMPSFLLSANFVALAARYAVPAA